MYKLFLPMIVRSLKAFFPLGLIVLIGTRASDPVEILKDSIGTQVCQDLDGYVIERRVELVNRDTFAETALEIQMPVFIIPVGFLLLA